MIVVNELQIMANVHLYYYVHNGYETALYLRYSVDDVFAELSFVKFDCSAFKISHLPSILKSLGNHQLLKSYKDILHAIRTLFRNDGSNRVQCDNKNELSVPLLTTIR